MKMFSPIQNLLSYKVIGTVLFLPIVPFGLVKTEAPASANNNKTEVESHGQISNIIDTETTEITLLSFKIGERHSLPSFDKPGAVVAQDEDRDDDDAAAADDSAGNSADDSTDDSTDEE